MKYAVTGGAGFIGSRIVSALVSDGHDVTVIDNMYAGDMKKLEPVQDKINFKKVDIRNAGELKDAIGKVDGIFHQAALKTVQESFKRPDEYHDVNVNGSGNIFDITEEQGIKTVFASSSSVYGNTPTLPKKEDDPKNPTSPYGKTKLESEELARQYTDRGVKIIGLRYFNVYGKDQSPEYAGVITKFMERLRDKKPPIITGEGRTRDFVYVEDVAKANIASMNSSTTDGFYNIGAGSNISIKELAETMIKAYGLQLEPERADELPGDVRDSLADISLASEKLGWAPSTKLEDGLAYIVKESQARISS